MGRVGGVDGEEGGGGGREDEGVGFGGGAEEEHPAGAQAKDRRGEHGGAGLAAGVAEADGGDEEAGEGLEEGIGPGGGSCDPVAEEEAHVGGSELDGGASWRSSVFRAWNHSA